MNMQDQGIWSLNLGRWGGVRVRLHMFFLLFAAFALYLGWREDGGSPGQYLLLAGLSVGILAVSVLIHEVGHLHAATYFGGGMDQMVIGPLGGLAPMRPPRDPRQEVVAHMAGPMVNLAVCGLCLSALLLSTPEGAATDAAAPTMRTSPWGLLNPLQPEGLAAGRENVSQQCLMLGVWINWLLFLVNLLPAFPFDGARALRAGLSQLWRRDGRRQAARIVSRVAQATSLGLVIIAVCLAAFGGREAPATVAPAWLALALMGIVLFFSAQRDSERSSRDPEDAFDYDTYFASSNYIGYDAVAEEAEDTTAGPIGQLIEERRAAKLRRQRELEEADEQRVDEILARLHAGGMGSLSPDDKALLERVSARYRNRQGNGA